MTVASIWRASDRPAISIDDSSELIQRAAAATIIAWLPITIPRVEALWAQRDADWATELDVPLIGTTIKPPNPRSVYTGHRLDLQTAPLGTFPAITCRCFDSAPADDLEQADQYDQIELTLIVEVWAAAGPFGKDDAVIDHASQDQIDRQLHRLASAVRAAINMDKSLGFTTMGIRRPPRARASLPFAVTGNQENVGKKFLVQAMELTYAISALIS